MSKQEKIAVLGGGAWGTAVSTVLSHNGHKVLLWCLEQDVVDNINSYHENKQYLKGHSLSKNIVASSDIIDVVTQSDYIFEAIPVKFLRTVLEKIKSISRNKCFVALSKGIELETFLLPTQIIQDILGNDVCYVVISGPGFAQEVAEKNFTGVMISGVNDKICKDVQAFLNNDYFKTFATSDYIGIQVGGALKNVCTLTYGIAQGKGYKANTSSYIFTKGLEDLLEVCSSLGGRKGTVYGFAGLGDLVLSSFDIKSKNLRAGMLLGKHNDMEIVKQNFSTLPEGINTIKAIVQYADKQNLKVPIFRKVYGVIFEQKTFIV
jgi:glycerol-3-phosphate dehydrogenase (NAD(P)+)